MRSNKNVSYDAVLRRISATRATKHNDTQIHYPHLTVEMRVRRESEAWATGAYLSYVTEHNRKFDKA